MNRRWTRTLFSALIVLSLGVGGWAIAHTHNGWTAPAEAKSLKNPVPVNQETLSAGRALYADKCANCHGDKGDGKGPEAETYSVPPSDFTDAQMMSEMTDGEIFWKITEGRRPMPSFKKQYTDEQRWQFVNYLRTFSKRALPSSLPAKPPAKKH
jgi:mono/diheme cytochrome c family protein